jgi:hypothetical protein
MSTWKVLDQGPWHIIAWGPPLVILAVLAGAAVHIGMMGVNYWDFAREWLARVAAFLGVSAFVWALLFAVAVFGPYWLTLLTLHWGKTAAGLGGAWLATTIGGVLAGKSPRTSGVKDNPKAVSPLEWIGKVAPTVFLVGFLLLISSGVFAGIGRIGPWHACPQHTSHTGFNMQASGQVTERGDVSFSMSTHAEGAVPGWLRWLEPVGRDYWCVLTSGAIPAAWWVFGICAFAALLMPLAININEFSMHHFYKNRIVRCYLGASRGEKRRPSGLTGFDPCDDFPLSSLLADPDAVDKDRCRSSKPYWGPYPIINGTVNLSAGSELAKQERQGESFIFTPLYSGFDPPRSRGDSRILGAQKKLGEHGYRETCNYAHPNGPAIGTCTAISGAAASPNHGHHTSAPLAFLLTVFDVRLGWWLS